MYAIQMDTCFSFQKFLVSVSSLHTFTWTFLMISYRFCWFWTLRNEHIKFRESWVTLLPLILCLFLLYFGEMFREETRHCRLMLSCTPGLSTRTPLRHLKASQLSRITIQIKKQSLPLSIIRRNLIPWETFQIRGFPD